jgi:hypothetical protein
MYAQGVYKIFIVVGGGAWPLLGPLVPPLLPTHPHLHPFIYLILSSVTPLFPDPVGMRHGAIGGGGSDMRLRARQPWSRSGPAW